MMYMYHSFLIYLSADEHLGCFHVLAVINSAVMNIGVHVSLSDMVSSVCMPSSGIAGSYGSSISSFLRNRGRLFYLSWLFFGTLHSNGNGLPFLLCFSLLFFSHFTHFKQLQSQNCKSIYCFLLVNMGILYSLPMSTYIVTCIIFAIIILIINNYSSA